MTDRSGADGLWMRYRFPSSNHLGNLYSLVLPQHVANEHIYLDPYLNILLHSCIPVLLRPSLDLWNSEYAISHKSDLCYLESWRTENVAALMRKIWVKFEQGRMLENHTLQTLLCAAIVWFLLSAPSVKDLVPYRNDHRIWSSHTRSDYRMSTGSLGNIEWTFNRQNIFCKYPLKTPQYIVVTLVYCLDDRSELS